MCICSLNGHSALRAGGTVWLSVAGRANSQTDGCIFARNSPFQGTQSPELCAAHRRCARRRCCHRMAQPSSASDKLKEYLAQLAPQVRGRLLAELERLLLEGEDLPRLEELIASLRS